MQAGGKPGQAIFALFWGASAAMGRPVKNQVERKKCAKNPGALYGNHFLLRRRKGLKLIFKCVAAFKGAIRTKLKVFLVLSLGLRNVLMKLAIPIILARMSLNLSSQNISIF
jgi:hypothetical protein